MRLSEVRSPRDLDALSYEELEDLAAQLRREIVATVSERGGHLASNLGAVELTIALHRVFAVPEDKILFDVGHQCYTHKLLTGRYSRFHTLRTFGGLSGFPKRAESEYDLFDTGHSSTAISAALGMARARDLLGGKEHVVAVVGDGALTGGMCYEALNDAGSSGTRLIVIVNDNEMSISSNVGALSRHLTDLRVSKGWTSAKRRVHRGLARIPGIGPALDRFFHRALGFVKSLFIDEGFFTSLGFHYYGPIDGHDIARLERTLQRAKRLTGPTVIHVITRKGYGYQPAEEDPEEFHGTPPFYVETGDARRAPSLPSFGSAMSAELCALLARDPTVAAISAAMLSGTGLADAARRWPDRVIDVGIAEEHAVTMAAGMAARGMKPYFAVYASFFQRAYDQMIEDVSLQGLPVTFLIDRAGLVGEDGATHHGVFDLASLLPVPGMTVLAPRDLAQLRAMMRFSAGFRGPLAIRYGKSGIILDGKYSPRGDYVPGVWEKLEDGSDCAILAVGSMVEAALTARTLLAAKGVSAAVVDCASVKPMDEKLLRALGGTPLVTAEEHLLKGGFGQQVCAFCAAERLPAPILTLGIPEMFVQHGSRKQLLKFLGLSPATMADRIEAALRESKRNDEQEES